MSGETRTYTCSFLISCTGYYNYDAGYLPTFPGVDRFKGRCVHPQHWPEDLDYAGKKVVVIGSGATAVTLIPAMAADVEHITMLQRSPSYVFSLPALDKISGFLGRFLPAKWVYGLARKRNIAVQRQLYLACRRWPAQMRRFLLWQVRQHVGPSVDMSHFTPKYMPWDERLCAGAEWRSVQGAEIRRGVGGHRSDRHLHRERHPVEVRAGTRSGHHRHRDRSEHPDARRSETLRRRASREICTTR